MWASIKETIKTVVYALLIAGVFRTFLFQPFWIPSGSMKETLLVGDFLFVNKMAYGYSYASCPSIVIPALGIDVDAEDFCGVFKGGNDRLMGSEPERGDVVVFRHPVTGRDFIKRLIGMPGDTVQMQDGQIILNGEIVPQQAAGLFTEPFVRRGQPPNFPTCSNGTVPIGEDCLKQRFTETLPDGRQYTVLNVGDRRLDTTGIFTVPEGQYFFMGDNRDNSSDSRRAQTAGGVGFVPFEDIVGRADRIMFSSSGTSLLAFWTWRSDRYFKAIE
ncbi:signal peptidase I [Pseudooctadecabacter jejudonensis]|uniref:Signal peptidase I n=1 Tax=Pseudooctadecabacter jejudonensis TaxID=1391910 RepID=A0A1Y5RZV9_9RHOB|nr:signal peptidase I [Pseudooctadecabacter jejudonensis]SLN29268.1 Signal peptidase I [Pseudooctadecabacter jejudonensis]